MSKDIEIQIAVASMRDKIPTDKPLAERIEFAMRYVREHEADLFWMSYDVNDDLMLRTALAAVMLAGNEEDREAITRALKPLQMLGAAMSGIPVDFSSFEDYADVLPLNKMWRETALGQTAAKGKAT